MSNVARVAGQAANTLVKPLELDELFSTYLYTGNGSTQTITNGIDLAGEGGLVVIKRRDATGNWGWYDTERGPDSHLKSNGTNAENTQPDVEVKDFNSDGFDLGTNWNAPVNTTNAETCSWTFRKTPKFFDIVTYTGNGPSNTQNISHNLGSAPGMLVVKATSTTDNWHTWHRGFGDNGYIMLNSTNAKSTYTALWDNTAPTATHFTVSDSCNTNNVTYVAYLFAHNDGDGNFGPNGNADSIKCGSYTGNGSATGPEIDLGFEPQWVLTKRTNSASSWQLVDVMRGMSSAYYRVFPDTSAAEDYESDGVTPTATGFKLTGVQAQHNASGGTYIYIAIRRPTAVPESATEVFGLNEYTGNNTAGRLITSSGTGVVDAAFINSSGSVSRMASRLTGIPFLTRDGTSAEINSNTRFENFDDMNGFFVGSNSQVNSSSYTYLAAMWTRAPNYFDVVAYTGNGTAGRTVSHNLTVPPEMMWCKRRDTSGWAWPVYHSGIANDPETDYLLLDSASGASDSAAFWNDTAPTASNFTVGTYAGINASGGTYIAYLFATLAGISKVGSYTGNGSSQTIDCGFTSGARYVLVKRTNTTGEWVEFNSEYGIVAGNEKAWRVNLGGDTGTSLDLIDPNSSGFIINQEASYNLNVNNSNYIFYAIA